MVAFDWQKTAENLRPHDFELMVRAYCKRMAWNVRYSLGRDGCAETEPGLGRVGMNFHIRFDSEGTMADNHWDICWNYGADTRGEVLADAATELVRRENWSKSPQATLRLIEG